MILWYNPLMTAGKEEKMLFKKGIVLLFLCALSVLFASCGPSNTAEHQTAAYTVTDIEGTAVDFPAPPKRIVTLSMSTDEVMLGLVEPARIAAVNSLLDDPVTV